MKIVGKINFVYMERLLIRNLINLSVVSLMIKTPYVITPTRDTNAQSPSTLPHIDSGANVQILTKKNVEIRMNLLQKINMRFLSSIN